MRFVKLKQTQGLKYDAWFNPEHITRIGAHGDGQTYLLIGNMTGTSGDYVAVEGTPEEVAARLSDPVPESRSVGTLVKYYLDDNGKPIVGERP